ncbi:MAG: hypothetical protein DRJ35_08095 [Thermoprotei archaeon]|nr:MAG: hypothetical protein DRJ35_08095 [Thermoprotei archaeon]
MDIPVETLAKLLIDGGIAVFVTVTLIYIFKRVLDTLLTDVMSRMKEMSSCVSNLSKSVEGLEKLISNDFKGSLRQLSQSMTILNANLEFTNRLLLETRRMNKELLDREKDNA